MIVAIGTRREPKLQAVYAVFERLGKDYPGFRVEAYHPRDVSSDTVETPITTQHLIAGAKNRVTNLKNRLREEHISADLFLGLEGGIHAFETPDGERSFLQSWVYAEMDNQGWYGSSGNLPLPSSLEDAVLENQRSLGDAIDVFAGKSGIRDDEGTFGILTAMRITRQQSFETALLSALAPLYNRNTYSIQLKES